MRRPAQGTGAAATKTRAPHFGIVESGVLREQGEEPLGNQIDSSETGPTMAADVVALESGSGLAQKDVAVSWSGLPVSNENDLLIGATLHDTYIVDHILDSCRCYILAHMVS